MVSQKLSRGRDAEMSWPDGDGMEAFLLTGEDVDVQVHGVVLVNTDVQGTLLVTNFRLLFVSEAPRQLIPLGTIPLAAIDKFHKQKARATSASRLLQVESRDMRILVYGFAPGTKQRKLIWDGLTRRLTTPRLWELYAFACGPLMMRNSNPNMRLLQEYVRLLGKGSGKSNKWWRISDVNSNYTVCRTYPSRFIMPSSISDREVWQAANFRELGRLPVITWCHPENGAVLARSSKPLLFGLINTGRSIADEKIVAALGASVGPRPSSGMNTKLIYIADTRTSENALYDGVLGVPSTESPSNYSQAEVLFLGIENAVAAAYSFSRLRDYLDTHGSASSHGSLSNHRNGRWNWGGLGGSDWVMDVHSVLAGSAWIAARIALQGASVLVHCSDGWDRTTQLVSLAGLLLDPYYRTFEGFQALIEKDWLAFGHPFADSLGMPTWDPRPAGTVAISSPIFVQWVDCVAQLLGIYPCAFEFSSAYLVEIVDCILSGRFGNFLCNTEKERQEAGVADTCACMWLYLTELRKSSDKSNIHEHCNILYSPNEHPGPLLPPQALLAPTLWSHFHLRWASPTEARSRSEIEPQLFVEFERAQESLAEDKLKDMATKEDSLTGQLVSEKMKFRRAKEIGEEKRNDMATKLESLVSEKMEIQRAKDKAEEKLKDMTTKLESLFSEKMEFERAKAIAEKKLKDMTTNLESLTEQLVSEKVEYHREKEIAEEKIQDMATSLESLTEQLVFEKMEHQREKEIAQEKMKDMATNLKSLNDGLVSQRMEFEMEKAIGEEKRKDMATKLESLVSEKMEIQRAKESAEEKLEDMATKLESLVSEKMEFERAKVIAKKKLKDMTTNLESLTEQLVSEKVEYHREKEIAEEKMQDMETSLESLTEQLVFEKMEHQREKEIAQQKMKDMATNLKSLNDRLVSQSMEFERAKAIGEGKMKDMAINLESLTEQLVSEKIEYQREKEIAGEKMQDMATSLESLREQLVFEKMEHQREKEIAEEKMKDMATNLKSLNDGLVSQRMEFEMEKAIGEEKRKDMATKLESLVSEKMEIQRAKESAEEKLEYMATKLESLVSEKMEFERAKVIAKKKLKDMTTNLESLTEQLVSEKVEYHREKEIAEEKMQDMATSLESLTEQLVFEKMEHQREKEIAQQKMKDMATNLKSMNDRLVSQSMEFERAKAIGEEKMKDMAINLESLTEQLVSEKIEYQREKEIAGEKLKDMAANLKSSTEQLVSEKSARRSAVAVATRAWREVVAIKRAVESVGCNIKISGSPYSICSDIASPEDIEEKIMSMSQQELSGRKDADEIKEQEDQEDDISVSLSVSVDRGRSPDVVDAQIGSEFSGVRANYGELEKLSINDSYFTSGIQEH